MTPEEFKRRALAHLDQCDEAEADQLATHQPGADLFADLHARFGHARAAFPGMTWEEFAAIATSRARKGKRGRPPSARTDDKLWLAAQDAGRIKELWKVLRSSSSRPPIHPHDLAAERHGVSRQSLDDRVNRPKARRPRNTA